METTEKAGLIGGTLGLVVALAFYYFTPEIHWGFHLGLGLLTVATASNTGQKIAKREKLEPRDIGSFAAFVVGLGAGVGTFYGLEGAHWGVSVFVGVLVGAAGLQADLKHRAETRQAGDL